MSGRPLAKLALLATACLGLLALTLSVVDLTPQVEADFFFASDDPQLAASAAIEKLFPSSPQILVRAAGDVEDPQYLASLESLTKELKALPGVAKVTSLTQGPGSPAAAAKSPLWSRLLLPAEGASSLLVEVEEGDSGPLVGKIEGVLRRQEGPLELSASGVPFVVELIRRHLLRDLRLFSIVSLLVFGLAAAWIYRSLAIALGTLLSCLTACALTLLALHGLGLKIGLLTANIITIVFVLTLSHMIFLSANWKRAEGAGKGRAIAAIRETLPASFWCMTTTALGFCSLFFATARPMRELGIAGAIGTAVALGVSYLLFPLFLRLESSPTGQGSSASEPTSAPSPSASRSGLLRGTVLVIAATLLAAPGLGRLTTDPSLLEYFDSRGELFAGLSAIDRDGGSSPLTMVLTSPDGKPLHRGDAFERFQAVQAAVDEDPAVGSALSLTVVLGEARRQPLAGFLSADQLLALLDSAVFDKIARSFITEDRKRALLFLRMREGERSESRQAVVERLQGLVADQGLRVEQVGGLYDLQGRLGRLVASSLLTGLGGLTLLFTIIALWVARGGRVAAVMVAGVVALPILMFGTFGFLGLPLDVIASPAANVALGLGIDSMIHLVIRRRKLLGSGVDPREAMAQARYQLKSPILTAALVVGTGFGVFALSSFPPTRHFGIAIVLGTAAAATWALTALPFLGAPGTGSAARLPNHS